MKIAPTMYSNKLLGAIYLIFQTYFQDSFLNIKFESNMLQVVFKLQKQENSCATLISSKYSLNLVEKVQKISAFLLLHSSPVSSEQLCFPIKQRDVNIKTLEEVQ